ncbi:unnamed protein product, partial [Urochloa humidicola]
ERHCKSVNGLPLQGAELLHLARPSPSVSPCSPIDLLLSPPEKSVKAVGC